MLHRFGPTLVFCALIVLGAGCAGAAVSDPQANDTTPPVVIPTPIESAETEPGSDEAPATPEAAVTDPAAALTAALEAKDYATLEGLMAAEFGFGLIASEGLTYTPAEMAAQLEQSYLGPGAVSVDLNRDIASEVGPDYQTLTGSFAQTLYSSGWGVTQADTALLFLDDQGAWAGMLYMFEGLETLLFAEGSPATASSGDDTSSAVATATPVESAVYTALGPFQEDLLEGITINRDYGLLQSLMGDSFAIGYWQSEGVTLSPAEASLELEATLLPPQAFVAYTLTGDLSSLLDGIDPLSVFGPDIGAVRAIHSTGWGVDGEGEAMLVIAQRPEGTYYWHGIIYAGSGF